MDTKLKIDKRGDIGPRYDVGETAGVHCSGSGYNLVCQYKDNIYTGLFIVNCGKTPGVTIDSYSLSCTKILGAYYSGNTRVYEACSGVVTKIEPVVATQNVERERIDFNLKLTYLDGQTRIMPPSSTDYDATKDYNGENVTLKYTGNITKAGTTGTLSTTLSLTTK